MSITEVDSRLSRGAIVALVLVVTVARAVALPVLFTASGDIESNDNFASDATLLQSHLRRSLKEIDDLRVTGGNLFTAESYTAQEYSSSEMHYFYLTVEIVKINERFFVFAYTAPICDAFLEAGYPFEKQVPSIHTWHYRSDIRDIAERIASWLDIHVLDPVRIASRE